MMCHNWVQPLYVIEYSAQDDGAIYSQLTYRPKMYLNIRIDITRDAEHKSTFVLYTHPVNRAGTQAERDYDLHMTAMFLIKS